MKVLITVEKHILLTRRVINKTFEMSADDAECPLCNGFWVLNQEKGKDCMILEIWLDDKVINMIKISPNNPAEFGFDFADMFFNFKFEVTHA